MVTYTLTVLLDDQIVQDASSDNLLLSQKVNNVYNVISQSASVNPTGVTGQQLSTINQFQWTTDYSVYLTKQYKVGVPIIAGTAPRSIELGEEVTVGSPGVLISKATKSSDIPSDRQASSFLVKDIPHGWHTAVAQKTGSGSPTTIWVDPDVHGGANDQIIEPKNSYLIYWGSIVDTESIYVINEGSDKKKFSFDDGETKLTLRFGYKVPNKPQGTEQAQWWDR